MNIPNILSILHLVLLPLVLYLVWKGTPFFMLLAIAILLFTVLTDIAGKIAGTGKATSSFLHPFSDKIVVLTLLFVFVLKGNFSGLIFGIFLLRDIIISYIRMIASRDDVVIRGELYGKNITALQFVLVFMVLAKNVFVLLERSFILVISILTV